MTLVKRSYPLLLALAEVESIVRPMPEDRAKGGKLLANRSRYSGGYYHLFA